MDRDSREQLDIRTAPMFRAAEAYIDLILASKADSYITFSDLADERYAGRDGIARFLYFLIHDWVRFVIKQSDKLSEGNNYLLFAII
jgi:hypothetical protein